jgi:hypothetical protein
MMTMSACMRGILAEDPHPRNRDQGALPGEVTAMALAGQTCRQPSQRVQRSGSMRARAWGVKGMASTGHCWAQRVQPMQDSVTV